MISIALNGNSAFRQEAISLEIDVNLNDKCAGLFFQAIPFPSDDNFFIGCIRGNGIILQCGQNEFFDKNINECIFDDRTTTTTTTTSTTTTTTAPPTTTTSTTTTPPTTTTQTTTQRPNLCEGIILGLVAEPDDCGLFLICIQEREFTTQECPAGQIFDENTAR